MRGMGVESMVIATVFHFAAFAVLAAGLVLSALLFTGLAIVLTGGGAHRSRPPNRRRSEHMLRRGPRFDLAIDR